MNIENGDAGGSLSPRRQTNPPIAGAAAHVGGLAACWLALAIALQSTNAAAQSLATLPAPIASEQQISAEDQSDNTGDDFDRPSRLFQLMYSYRTAPGNGAEVGTIRETTNKTLNFRLDNRIDLTPQWTLGLRADLPFRAKNPINADNPDGNYLHGVGDADFQTALIYTFDARWKAGFGVRLFAPTGSDDIGAGKWQLMPGAAVRYAWPELSPGSYVEPLIRYDASFAGDPNRRNIGNLQFAPTLNIGLGEHWFLTLYPSPDIRVNFSDPVIGQTGRLFVPVDARIGRKFGENAVLSLEVGAPIIKDYPVYDFKTQLRLNVNF